MTNNEIIELVIVISIIVVGCWLFRGTSRWALHNRLQRIEQVK